MIVHFPNLSFFKVDRSVAASMLPDANSLPNLRKPEDGTVSGVVKQITD
jgi:hypothetical protein